MTKKGRGPRGEGRGGRRPRRSNGRTGADRGWGWAALVAGGCLIGSASGQEGEGFKDWAMRCPEKAPCLLEQRVLLRGQEATPLLHVAFQRTGNGEELAMLLKAPLGVLLQPGVAVSVDGGKARTLPFHHCRGEGCMVLGTLDPALRRDLERGSKAEVAYFSADGRRLGVPLSLLGITAGLRALPAPAAGAPPAPATAQ